MPFQWTDPNALGLLYDVVGILILGVPAVFVLGKTLASESSSGFGGTSSGLARRLAEQGRRDLAPPARGGAQVRPNENRL